MPVKDTCPSCGSPVAPDDLLCANCELILDAKRIPDQPTGSEISVVRRMLEWPQAGVPTEQPTRIKKKPEKPTKVFPRETKVTRVPIVVASLTRKMGQLNELEAYLVSFIDGEHDVAELAHKSKVPLHEVNVVLQSLNDKMVIDFADEPEEELVKPTVEGHSPSIKFDPSIFNVPESKPQLEPLSFLPTPVSESRLAAHDADEELRSLRTTDERDPTPAPSREPPTEDQEAERDSTLPKADTATTQLLEPVPSPSLAVTQPITSVRPMVESAPPTELMIPIFADDGPTPARALAEALETPVPAPAPSPPFRSPPSPTPPPHVRPPPDAPRREPAPPRSTPPAPPSPPRPSSAPGAAPPEVVLPPPSSRPRRVLKPASLPPNHGTAPTPAEGTPMPSQAALELPSGTRPTVQLALSSVDSTQATSEPPWTTGERSAPSTRPTGVVALDQLPFDADEAPATPIAPPAPSRPPPTLIDPDLQKMKEAFRAAKPPESPSLPSVIVADAAPRKPSVALEPTSTRTPPVPLEPGSTRTPVPLDSASTRTPPALEPVGSTRTPPVPLEAIGARTSPISPEPVASTRTPPVPLEPVTSNATPSVPLEPVTSVPSPSRPRRKLPAGARSGRAKPDEKRTPIDPPADASAEKRTTPIESPPVALADAPVLGTDPRIVSKGQANRRVLDALKQVKRRDAGEPSVEMEQPSDHGTRADRLAAGTLQVAIRMEQGGRLDEAVRYLEGAIAKSPDAPTLYNRLAIILMREHGDLLRAEHLLQKAIELAPDNPVYEKNLQAVVQKRAMRGK